MQETSRGGSAMESANRLNTRNHPVLRRDDVLAQKVGRKALARSADCLHRRPVAKRSKPDGMKGRSALLSSVDGMDALLNREGAREEECVHGSKFTDRRHVWLTPPANFPTRQGCARWELG
jgi:hypothetical protein